MFLREHSFPLKLQMEGRERERGNRSKNVLSFLPFVLVTAHQMALRSLPICCLLLLLALHATESFPLLVDLQLAEEEMTHGSIGGSASVGIYSVDL